MRILQVINDLKMGGAETMLVTLCRLMVEQGHEIEVLTLGESPGPLREAIQKSGVRLTTTRRRSVYHPRNILDLRQKIRAGVYDIVHVHLFPSQLWAAVAVTAVSNPTPVVTTEHSTWNRRRRYPLGWLDRWVYSRFSMTFAISDGVKEALRHWASMPASSIEVVPNGIDLKRFQSGAPPAKLPGAQRFKAMCIGSLTAAKNHGCLLEALATVPDLDLMLVGSGGQRAALQRQAEDLGVANRVYFLGTRTDIPNLLAAADVYVQPSRWEGFGIAVLEAMAAGLPVVASRVPGLSELVGESAALLVDPEQPRAWSTALRRVLADAPLQGSLRHEARRQAARFAAEATAERYLDAYRRTIAQGRGTGRGDRAASRRVASRERDP